MFVHRYMGLQLGGLVREEGGGGGWGVGLEAAVGGIANKLSVRKLWFYVLDSLSSNDGDGDENVT